MNGWQSAYLRAAGIAPTPDAAGRLGQWQSFEGGATHNTATFNYLNSKMPMPGSRDAIGNGVQGYPTLASGALAFARTIKGRAEYAALRNWLATGQGDPSEALQVWVSGHPNGDPGYASKVLGREVPTAARRARVAGSSTLPAPGAPPSSVRDTAAQGFADIAQGKAQPTDTFEPLIGALRDQGDVSAPPSAPGRPPAAPKASGATGPLEKQAAALVKKYLGVNYQWGGTTPQGFDCSGLIQYVYRSLGVNIPRTTFDQWDSGKAVDANNLQPGDAVFFTGSDPRGGKPGHEGLYIGNGLFIEAPHTGAQVRVSKLSDTTDFVGARRF